MAESYWGLRLHLLCTDSDDNNGDLARTDALMDHVAQPVRVVLATTFMLVVIASDAFGKLAPPSASWFTPLDEAAATAWDLPGDSDSTSHPRNEAVRPFRIIGNVYYVGASDIAIYLIVTTDGLILLDGGYADMPQQVLRNIRALGFDPRQVRILLNSHAHYDHAGGLAELKRVTGAPLYAGRGDSVLLAHGGHDDFAFGNRFLFPPVTVDHAVSDGDSIILGRSTIVAVATPGHTKGCTTWAMTVRDGDKTYHVLFICSLSIPGYDLRHLASYPTIGDDYRASIAKLRRLPCDIFLAPHASMFGLSEKMPRARAATHPSPFSDPVGCRTYLDSAEADLNRRLAEPAPP